ncbi:MAG: SoxR reducing system RseC family protein [Spirochaetaceae bacterium]|jgi:positive regulator of sigma E activity|nr:SoxR reducing system RseC family protein [Spirochaetaceae bacterium]
MREAAQVLEVRGHEVTVLGKGPEDVCFGCMNIECKKGGRVFTVCNPRELPLKAGDLVELEIKKSAGAFEAGMSLLLPVLAFLALYCLGPLLFHAPDGAARIGLAFLALLAGALGVFLFRKIKPPQQRPSIVRKNPLPA